MARPLRITVPDGWYHVFHRGTERCAIFADDRDRAHFLDLLAELSARYRFEIHGYALMTTHYHAIIQIPDANLSAGLQWLHTSHAAWFNTRHQRVGPLWQGRFGSVPVENSAWAYELSLYVHLNPVCTELFELGKRWKRVEALGLRSASPEQITHRLKGLRTYLWSSYRAYAGYENGPDWLVTKEILARASRRKNTRVARYREDAKNLLRKGGDEERTEKLFDALAIGGEMFRTRVRDVAAGGGRETSGRGLLRRRIGLDDALRAVESVKGEARGAFLTRHGDWGATLVMYLLRHQGGLTLREIGEAFDGMDYAAVSARLCRLDRQVKTDRTLKRQLNRATQILNIET